MDTNKKIGNEVLNSVCLISEREIEVNDSYTKNLIEDYDFDSIMFVQLISEIEEKFDILIDDKDLDIDKLSNLKELILLVQQKMEN